MAGGRVSEAGMLNVIVPIMFPQAWRWSAVVSLAAIFVALVSLPLLIHHSASAQPVASDRVQSLPSLSDADLPVQYAGYLPIDDDFGSRLFYWLVRASPQAQTDHTGHIPLTIWFNGGPGCSSMVGGVLENGPFQVSATPSSDTVPFTLTPNPHSWHHVSHVLYIDQPIGTGYSHLSSDPALTYARTETKLAEHVVKALLHFFKDEASPHHELLQSQLYLTGES